MGSTLKNLDVDVLDAVVVHWPICLDAPTSESEHAYVRRLSWEALESMVDDGVIRHLGVSNWTPELLDELLEVRANYARELGKPAAELMEKIKRLEQQVQMRKFDCCPASPA